AVDASKTPAWIDIKKGEMTFAGIYKLDGDKLHLCADLENTGERPTAFDSKKAVYYILVREGATKQKEKEKDKDKDKGEPKENDSKLTERQKAEKAIMAGYPAVKDKDGIVAKLEQKGIVTVAFAAAAPVFVTVNDGNKDEGIKVWDLASLELTKTIPVLV